MSLSESDDDEEKETSDEEDDEVDPSGTLCHHATPHPLKKSFGVVLGDKPTDSADPADPPNAELHGKARGHGRGRGGRGRDRCGRGQSSLVRKYRRFAIRVECAAGFPGGLGLVSGFQCNNTGWFP